ncbi:MAG: porin family protein [Paludibacteraceae bacterium]
MNTKIFSFIVLLIFANFSRVSGQENDTIVHKSVTVTREFQPVINDAGKIITSPAVVEPTVEKSKPVYSDITVPLNISTHVQILKPEELLHAPSQAKKGFLRLGVGYPLNTLGDFMYPVLSNPKNRLDVALHHLGAFDEKTHSKTTGSLQFNHLFNNFDLYAGVGGSHDYFNYYARSFAGTERVIMSDAASRYGDAVYTTPERKTITLYELSGLPLNDTQWRFNANVGARSLPLADNLIFDASLNYDLFKSMGNNLKEDQILLKGSFNVPFDKNRLGIDVDIYNFQYNRDSIHNFFFPDRYSVLKLNPFWKLTGDNWFLRLGVKTGLSIGAGQFFTPSPDISAEWYAVPKYLAVYGGATGDLTVNSLNRVYNENRYLSAQNRLLDTYTPIDAYLGLKVSPVFNLLLDAYGEYKMINNQYFYINRPYVLTTASANQMPADMTNFYHNRFDVIYAEASCASLGLRTAWDYKNLINIYLKGAYHHWSVAGENHAWQLPRWDADFGTSVKINNDVNVNTQFIFQDGRYAKLSDIYGTKMAPVLDWNLGATYAYRDWMSFFLKLNNILNKKYEIYSGYDVQGINVMVGAAFSF